MVLSKVICGFQTQIKNNRKIVPDVRGNLEQSQMHPAQCCLRGGGGGGGGEARGWRKKERKEGGGLILVCIFNCETKYK